MTDDVRMLLGGYATGTLSEEEHQALFAAALDDQQLFEALANEQALKELLDDSSARAQLLQATDSPRFSVRGGLQEWFARPKAKVLAGAGALTLALIIFTAVRDSRNMEIPFARHSPPAIASSPPAREPAASVVTEKLVQTVASGDAVLRYTLLKKTGNGTLEPVPVGYSFSSSDSVAIRAESNVPGGIAVSVPSRQLNHSATLETGEAQIIPRETAIPASDLEALFVAFIPRSARAVPGPTISISIKIHRKD